MNIELEIQQAHERIYAYIDERVRFHSTFFNLRMFFRFRCNEGYLSEYRKHFNVLSGYNFTDSQIQFMYSIVHYIDKCHNDVNNKAMNCFYIKGRGRAYCVVNEKQRPRDASDLIGQIVTINDNKYRVKGVESNCIMGPLKVGEKISLLAIPVCAICHADVEDGTRTCQACRWFYPEL